VDARSYNSASNCQVITPTECLCVTAVMNLAIYRMMMSLHFLCRVIECKGPTNTRVYTVAVYFRGERLAKASGHSIQQAEMNAAKEALELSQGLCK
jgi:dsRNA-specific ribonuclease